MKTKKRKITLMTRLAYGSGNLLGSGALAISGAWLLFFYTTFCGLPVFQAALIFSISTYLDVILNPLMGFITDNFYNTRLGKKFGRRRFFIMIGIPLMIIYPLLWITGMNFFYYLITYIMFEMTYTMVMIPYETLAVEMTNSFTERTYLTGFKAMFGKIANFIGAALPGVFFATLGKSSPYSFLATGVVYGTIMIIALSLLYFNSWERPVSEVREEHVESIWDGFKKLFIDIFSTLRIRAFRDHLGMYLFGFGSEWLFTAVFTYYIVFVLGQQSTFVSELNSMSAILQLVSTALFMFVCAKKGFTKPFSFALGMVISAVLAYGAITFFHLSSISGIVIAITAWFGLGTGGVYYIPWTTYVFMADIDEVVTNRRREGIYSGAMTMAGKLIRATVVFILGVVLQFFGFKEGATNQPASAIYAILGVMVIGVITLAVLGIICSSRLKLDKHNHQLILDELDRVHKGGSPEDVTPETRKAIKELSGFDYEHCFGNNTVGYHEKKDPQVTLTH